MGRSSKCQAHGGKNNLNQRNTLLFRVWNASPLARSIKLTCWKPVLLSILDLNLHDTTFSRVFSITSKLPACSLIILLSLR